MYLRMDEDTELVEAVHWPLPAWKPTGSSKLPAPSTATKPNTSATPPRPSDTG